MTQTDMTTYYARRAAEYEQIYHKPERQQDLTKLRSILAQSFAGLDVLEIACGTGYWTQYVSQSARSILATDYNDEVLAIARTKTYGDCPVTFTRTDAYELNEINSTCSAALAGFWWSHVPKTRLHDFLRVLHAKLAPGALIVMLDNLYVEGSSTAIHRTDADGNTYQLRTLADGSSHEVIKNFPSPQTFRQCITPLIAGGDISFSTLDYFWLAHYRLPE